MKVDTIPAFNSRERSVRTPPNGPVRQPHGFKWCRRSHHAARHQQLCVSTAIDEPAATVDVSLPDRLYSLSNRLYPYSLWSQSIATVYGRSPPWLFIVSVHCSSPLQQSTVATDRLRIDIAENTAPDVLIGRNDFQTFKRSNMNLQTLKLNITRPPQTSPRKSRQHFCLCVENDFLSRNRRFPSEQQPGLHSLPTLKRISVHKSEWED